MSKYSTLHLALQELTEKSPIDRNNPEEHYSCIYDDYDSQFNIYKTGCNYSKRVNPDEPKPCHICVACSPIRLKRIDSELRSLL